MRKSKAMQNAIYILSRKYFHMMMNDAKFMLKDKENVSEKDVLDIIDNIALETYVFSRIYRDKAIVNEPNKNKTYAGYRKKYKKYSWKRKYR